MRLLLAMIGLLAAAATAAGQGRVQPPPGWSSQAERNGIVMRSPADAAGLQVVYAVRAAEPVSGNVDAWFAQIIARTIGTSAIVQRSGLQREQTLLKEAVVVRRADGSEIRIDAMTYGTPQGQQVLLILFPWTLGTQDPRVNQAYDHAAALRRSGYSLTATGVPPQGVAPPRTGPSAPAQPGAAPPRTAQPGTAAPRTAQPPPASTPGRNCRREPVWGQRISPFCKPSGICSDRVIKEYRTVCS